jgi:site-specific DNA-methyltransferase (adenine-specific)
MGSGSTGVACKNMKRNFIGIEMDDEIFEGACKRVYE